VRSFSISPAGAIPDDYIASFELSPEVGSNDLFHARLLAAGLMPTGERGEVTIAIVGQDFYLEDP
jgi:hypothetical protein